MSKKRVEPLDARKWHPGPCEAPFQAHADSQHGGPIAPNVLARQFTATELKRAWVTDVTAIATGEGWLYLARVLDLFSRRVVGWAASANNDTALALDTLKKALRAGRRSELVDHERFPTRKAAIAAFGAAAIEPIIAAFAAEEIAARIAGHRRFLAGSTPEHVVPVAADDRIVALSSPSPANTVSFPPSPSIVLPTEVHRRSRPLASRRSRRCSRFI